MKPSDRRVALGVAGLGLAAALGIAYVGTSRFGADVRSRETAEPVEIAPAPARQAPALDADPATEAMRLALVGATGLSEEEREAVDGLLSRLRGPFSEPRVRVDFLEQLVAWLRREHPDTWLAELERILRAAFPSEADALLALWRSRDGFEQWMDSHRVEVARMPNDARREAMWAARRQYFGADADRIFAGVRRNEALADVLETIDANPEGDVPDRFGRYVRAIEEQYGDDAPRYLEDRRQEVLDRFVALNSIQGELAAMDRPERYETLRAIRVESGMADDALARWDSLDRTRDDRWDAGARYTAESAALASRLAGAELEEQLALIRERYFGAEAETIAHEEASGYFRFRDVRTFGTN